MDHAPVHPGEILRKDVIESLGLSIQEAADWLGLSPSSLLEVLNAHADLTQETALRLEALGVGTADTWLNLQSAYALYRARLLGGEDS